MGSFAPLSDHASVSGILAQISILGGVSDAQQSSVFHRFEIGRFRAGEAVFERGSEPTHLYVVGSGKLELVVLGEKEEVVKRKELLVGEAFGEVSLMSMQRHSASVFALEESEVLALSKHSLISIQREDLALFAVLMMNISRELARRLQFTDDLLMSALHRQKPPSAASPGQ